MATVSRSFSWEEKVPGQATKNKQNGGICTRKIDASHDLAAALYSRTEVTNNNNQIRFGVFKLELEARELRKHGIRIKLEDQPFEVLTALLEKWGDIVTHGELQARLWPEGTFVDFDKGLTKAVNKIRTALGDSAANPRFIETLSRHGYRFIAPIDSPAADGPPVAQIAPTAAVGPRATTGVLTRSRIAVRRHLVARCPVHRI